MGRFALLYVTVAFAAMLVLEYNRLTIKPWPPKHFETAEMHFKYGSIGAEVNGYPYLIWRELPHIFKDRLPGGFAEFGFLQEPGEPLPIGVSVRRYGVKRVGFNCATCHTTAVAHNGASHLVNGAPAGQLDLQHYIRFIIEASFDLRLTADAVFASADANGRPFSFIKKLAYRYVVFPRLKEQIADIAASYRWMDRRPDHGPGRTDAGNFWRARWGLEPEKDQGVGVVDFPPVWNQRLRVDGSFHWDGNNASLDERNISAALAGGAAEWLLQRNSIDRVSNWLMDLEALAYPGFIDGQLATRGETVYEREECGVCHDVGSRAMGQVSPTHVIGTDPERTDLFSHQMVAYFGQVGKLYSWRFHNYRVTDGYANAPLDGIWARAPYLHNGSVPTLAALLMPAADRPDTFYSGCKELDEERVGFTCQQGFEFDTRLRGNANDGHEYGTSLSDTDKRALLEYLKTL